MVFRINVQVGPVRISDAQQHRADGDRSCSGPRFGDRRPEFARGGSAVGRGDFRRNDGRASQFTQVRSYVVALRNGINRCLQLPEGRQRNAELPPWGQRTDRFSQYVEKFFADFYKNRASAPQPNDQNLAAQIPQIMQQVAALTKLIEQALSGKAAPPVVNPQAAPGSSRQPPTTPTSDVTPVTEPDAQAKAADTHASPATVTPVAGNESTAPTPEAAPAGATPEKQTEQPTQSTQPSPQDETTPTEEADLSSATPEDPSTDDASASS